MFLNMWKISYTWLYYKWALAIYEQSLSYSHHDRWNVESKVERFSAEIGNNQFDEVDI